MKEVQYKSVGELKLDSIKTIKDCVFIKSKPFKQEKEIRIVTYQSKTDENKNVKIVDYLSELPSDVIKSIRLSPFLGQKMYGLFEEILHMYLAANNWPKIEISQSCILNKDKWQNALSECVSSIEQ